MPKTTFNSEQSIDFIKTIAALAEPFNTKFLENYEEYLDNKDNPELCTTNFLGALNLIGQDGCKFLYDKVINYIDDISNVDTCKLDSLYSITKTLQVPYKNKQTLEFLSNFSKSQDILQLILWIMSCNTRNTKYILERLGIATEEELKRYRTKKDIFSSFLVSSKLKFLIRNIFIKTHTYPLESSYEKKYLIGFYWNFLPLIEDFIYSDKNIYNLFIQPFKNSSAVHKIDFGKYNFTIHEHTCIKFIQLSYTNIINEFNNKQLSTEIFKKYLPFLYNNFLFDPIAAAQDILFNSGSINKYTDSQKENIENAIRAINSTGQFVLDLYSLNGEKPDISQLNMLNSYVFSNEFLINQISKNVKEYLNIDVLDYFKVNNEKINDISQLDWWKNNFSSTTTNVYSQFKYIDISIDNSDDPNILIFHVDDFVDDIYESFLKISKKILILREDLKLLTMRNAFKGTNAIVQFATAEYLNEHLENIVDNVINEISLDGLISNEDKLSLKKDEELINALNKIYENAIIDSSDVEIIEYWDSTEYFGRTKDNKEDMYPADWNTKPWTIYGNTSKSTNTELERDSLDIVKFYKNTLDLPENILKGSNLDSLINLDDEVVARKAQENLMTFLRGVYNAGVYSKSLPNNLEKIFSGNPNNNLLRQFYTNYKSYSVDVKNIIDRGNDRISKQVHPYIWNFTSDSSGLAISVIGGTPYTSSGTSSSTSGTISIIQQDLEIKLLNELVSELGNLLDQWRLSLKYFTDESNYWTRYEAYEHESDLSVVCYDGYVYPPFALELKNLTNSDDLLNHNLDNETTIYQKWYRKAGGRALRKDEIELENKILQTEFNRILNSLNISGGNNPSPRIMKNYSVDIDGYAYGIDLINTNNNKATIFYKDPTYPFMRPLRQIVDNEQLGMVFIDDNNEKIEDFEKIELNYQDNFPNIVISENGKYILLRLENTKLGFFTPTYYINEIGHTVKALKLLYIVDCEEFLNNKTFNDLSSKIVEGGVKTLNNSISILLTEVVGSFFNEYLLTLGPSTYKFVKMEIKCNDEVMPEKMTAGLTLTDDTQNNNDLIISTFGIATKISEYDYIHGYKKSDSLKTEISSTYGPDTSFDIFEKFIHMFVHSNISSNILTLNTLNLSRKEHESLKIWNIKLPEIPITKKVTFSNNGFKLDNRDLYNVNTIPFAKRFNLNSDAGYNPCYIGEEGKLVLPDRKKQYSLAKTSGTAISLLGPSIDYSDIEIDTTDSDNKEYATRIHESCYEFINKEQSSKNDSVEVKIDNVSTTVNQTFHRYFQFSDVFYNGKTPRIFKLQLNGLSKADDKYTSVDSLDLESTDAKYVTNSITFPSIDTGLGNLIGNAYLMFRTNYSDIWIPIALTAEDTIIDDDDGFNKKLFDIIFGTKISSTLNLTYKILTTSGEKASPYIFDEINIIRSVENGDSSTIKIAMSGSLPELINIEVIIIGFVGKKDDPIPASLLVDHEFAKAISVENEIKNNTSFHVRVPHTHKTDKYSIEANKILGKTNGNNYLIYEDATFTIDDEIFKNGSAVLSMEEKDSVLLTTLLPNQTDTIFETGKSVLGELLNELFRYSNYPTSGELGTDINTINSVYDYRYYQFHHLNLINDDDDDISTLPQSNYLVQLSKNDDSDNHLSFLKHLTYSAWRRAEFNNTVSGILYNVENTLPKNVKVTEDYKPVLFNTVNGDDISNLNIIPKLAIRWKKKNDLIELRFDNAALGDSIFINKESNLNYVSLANTNSSVQLMPGNHPALFSIISPIHIIAGNTVFTDIPLSTMLLSNVSDDKPKFMLSLNSDLEDASNSDAYALVFVPLNIPEIENKNSIMIQCYVSKLDNLTQTNIPLIDKSIKLKTLLFNLDIANVLNTELDDSIDARDNEAIVRVESVYGKTYDHIIKSFKQSSAIRQKNHNTIKVSITAEEETEQSEFTPYFSVIDLGINFHNITKYTLKNALITAFKDQVIAIDESGKRVYIAKVFGCDFNKIGVKKVLGTYYGTDDDLFINFGLEQYNWNIPINSEEPEIPVEVRINGELLDSTTISEGANVMITKQAEQNRETAILVNVSEEDLDDAILKSSIKIKN